MATADLLADRLTELKTAALAAMTLARTGNEVPGRVYASHGRPAVDYCDGGLLAVYLDSPAVDLRTVRHDRAIQHGQHGMMGLVRLVVEVWRCVPAPADDGAPPSAAALDASALALARDGHALWTGLRLARAAGALFPAGDDNVEPEIGDPTPLAPQGLAAGWQIKVGVPITRTDAPPV